MCHYHATLKNYEDEVARRQLEDEAARDQAVEDQNRRYAEQDRQEAQQGVSRNLEPDFFRMARHNVYTTLLENLLTAKNALAIRANPNLDDQRVVILLQSVVMQLRGRVPSMQDQPVLQQPNPVPQQ
jgi:hypothetical protein